MSESFTDWCSLPVWDGQAEAQEIRDARADERERQRDEARGAADDDRRRP